MRLRRLVASVSCTAAAAAGLVAAAAVLLPTAGGRDDGNRAADVVSPVAASRTGTSGAPGTEADAISRAQVRLATLPGDWPTWAELGAAYVQQARITADPSYYPKAEGALQRSLSLRAGDNWQAMTGMGALANARHDFAAGLAWGRRAEKVNPHAGSVYGVIADALTQLGDYPAARDAVQRMLDVQPGIASFSRASYDFEMHGQVDAARTALRRALDDAESLADIAFCRYYLGDLAFNDGRPREARQQYRAALAADPGYAMARAGVARAEAALGQRQAALAEGARAVQALPLPTLLIEYGDLLAATGRHADARRQYALLAAEQRLFAANGVSDHLTAATFLADHGDAPGALREARAEWAVRHSVLAADALAWALHRNHRDTEALGFSTRAARLGWRNAVFRYHRGAIELSLHRLDSARADLAAALAINPHFDILQAPAARRLLSTVEDHR